MAGLKRCAPMSSTLWLELLSTMTARRREGSKAAKLRNPPVPPLCHQMGCVADPPTIHPSAMRALPLPGVRGVRASAAARARGPLAVSSCASSQVSMSAADERRAPAPARTSKFHAGTVSSAASWPADTRARASDGTPTYVSRMPSGPVMRCATSVPQSCAFARSVSAWPSRPPPRLEYSTLWPGARGSLYAARKA